MSMRLRRSHLVRKRGLAEEDDEGSTAAHRHAQPMHFARSVTLGSKCCRRFETQRTLERMPVERWTLCKRAWAHSEVASDTCLNFWKMEKI
jgi:hypothetical protein